MGEKYYKVLNFDGISPTTNFDYSPYLPKNGKAGKWLPKIENAKIRKDGYYASKFWNMWYSEGKRIFEVELADKFTPQDNGVEHQVCSSQMRLIKDVTDEILREFSAAKNALPPESEKWNIGAYNTGIGNIGANNCGEFNEGNRNTGRRNKGNFNTGDANVGMDNVGDNNIGSANAGSHNCGHSNCGDFNKGSYNSGSFNAGHKNSGSFNAGNSNSGKWNIGNFHTGFFNTEPVCATMFNKPVNIPPEKIKLPKWLNKPNPKDEFEKAPENELLETLKLPNFDFDIFEKITGVSKKDFERRLKK